MSAGELIEKIAEAAKQTSWLEYAAVISSIAYVILAASEKILCWLFGILSSLIYVYLCFISKLYLETFLMVFYVAMGFYGWYQWETNKGKQDHAPVISWKFTKHIYLLATGAATGIVLGFLFERHTDAAQPYLDAFITSYSLIATWMVTKKVIQNWIYWIIIDAASIILYGNRELYLTSLLYLIFTVLAVAGYFAWKKELARPSIA
jgi:nicotinamide mononucleotide transporter